MVTHYTCALRTFSYSASVFGISAFCAGAAGFGAPAVAGFLGASFFLLLKQHDLLILA